MALQECSGRERQVESRAKKLEGVVWEDIGRTFNPVVESFLEKRPSSRDLKEKQVKESKGFVLCTWARRQEFESLRNL